MKETLDDIVFENRNKEYGAYYLRKNYSRYLTRATVIGATIFCVSLGGALAFNKINASEKEREVNVDLSVLDMKQEVPEEEIIEIPEELPPPPLNEPPPEVAQEKFLPPEPKKDDEVKFEEPPPPAEKLETALISNKTVEGEAVKDVFTPPPVVKKEATVVKIEAPKEEEIHISVEQNPEFPGGEAALRKFLNSNVKYPNGAQRANISGRVTVQFVVEKDGSIGQVKVLKGIGWGCDEEAMRVIKAMPKWNPGKQNGKPVRVFYNLPVVYTLE